MADEFTVVARRGERPRSVTVLALQKPQAISAVGISSSFRRKLRFVGEFGS